MKRKWLKLPRPGLQGDYQESCIICLHGCDTGLAIKGEAEWIIAGLTHLGIPSQAEAFEILRNDEDWAPGTVPDGILTVQIKLCESCAQKSDSKVAPFIPGESVPCYRQSPGI
jgi:hypothetical protein